MAAQAENTMAAADVIARLGLARHPEGGWYRETLRRPAPTGGRDAMTAIHFLLEADQRSHWHRVDAEELWLWHAGSPLTLGIVAGAGIVNHTLGGNVLAGELPQLLVPTGAWQTAVAGDGWSLVSCVVVPGFDFAGFELAPAGWTPT